VDAVTGALLDTSILIAKDNVALPPTAAISVMTLGELHAGVLLTRHAETRALRSDRLEAVRATFAPCTSTRPSPSAAAEQDRTLYTLDRRQAELAVAAGISVSRGSGAG
jgi:hypothetical protein